MRRLPRYGSKPSQGKMKIELAASLSKQNAVDVEVVKESLRLLRELKKAGRSQLTPRRLAFPYSSRHACRGEEEGHAGAPNKGVRRGI